MGVDDQTRAITFFVLIGCIFVALVAWFIVALCTSGYAKQKRKEKFMVKQDKWYYEKRPTFLLDYDALLAKNDIRAANKLVAENKKYCKDRDYHCDGKTCKNCKVMKGAKHE